MKNRMALCNWSPIRTAPKDGTTVWLGDESQLTTACWAPVGTASKDGKRVVKRKRWVFDHAVTLDFTPTHWQRIPNPPGA